MSTAGSLITTPILMIGGAFWPSESMPVFLQRLGYISPVSWFMQALEKIIHGATIFEVSGEIIILLLFAVAFFLLGVFKKVDVAT